MRCIQYRPCNTVPIVFNTIQVTRNRIDLELILRRFNTRQAARLSFKQPDLIGRLTCARKSQDNTSWLKYDVQDMMVCRWIKLLFIQRVHTPMSATHPPNTCLHTLHGQGKRSLLLPVWNNGSYSSNLLLRQRNFIKVVWERNSSSAIT